MIQAEPELTFTHDFRGGVFLKFSAKPGESIRATLKAAGFRWSSESGTWWRNRVSGAAEFVDYLQKQIDREAGIRRPDGACWRCKSANGFFRNRGAAAPVLCDTCNQLESAAMVYGCMSH